MEGNEGLQMTSLTTLSDMIIKCKPPTSQVS